MRWFWQKEHDEEPNATKGNAVPFQRGTGSSGNVLQLGTSGSLLRWFGDNIEGYDRTAPGLVDYTAYRPSDNSIVAACLNWICTGWAMTPLLVGKMNGGKFEPLDGGHPLQELMKRPHPDYDGDFLISAWMRDLFDEGSFYANIVTAGRVGPPKELQILPASRMTPRDPDDRRERLIGWYAYAADSKVVRIEPESVLRGMLSADPTDLKTAVKPLYSARREIATDNLASEVSAALMRKPHPSGILSPDGEVEVDPDDMAVNKQKLSEATTGSAAGGVVAFPVKVKWQQLSFNPKDLALDDARRKPEERVCALFGLPPVVVGLGAGLERSTYNNMAEARKAAWHDCLIPLQDYVAALLTERLLPLYGGDPLLVCMWDRSTIGVLQPDKTEERKVAIEEYKAGLITANEYRAAMGMEPVTEPGADELKKPAPAPVPGQPNPNRGNDDDANGNGSGGAKDYELPPFPYLAYPAKS